MCHALCVVRRWYKELGVAIASELQTEGKVRAEANKYISGDNLCTELTPFILSTKDKLQCTNGLSRKTMEKNLIRSFKQQRKHRYILRISFYSASVHVVFTA